MTELDLSALDELDLASYLPGEDVLILEDGERWGRDAIIFDLNGHPLPGDIVEQARAFEELRRNGENHFVTSMWWQDTPLEVSTVYLGVNHQYFDGPPLVWETMLFGGLDRKGKWQCRYTTRAAAFTAHQAVVECLLSLGLVLADGNGGTLAEVSTT